MYTVLARKWRPQTFGQTLGQSHVLTTLKNAIEMDRVAHAYLFSGPRGVGKTSVSRILAKSLNCVQGPTVEPCGECRHCVEIMQGQSLDVLEIDGASNRRIDDIRKIEDHVKFTPVDGKFKIYIIDEVHMLTKEAFNALLKTLEEPPGHVKFIFATTEDDKIPDTIHSRCQHFAFRRLSLDDIVTNLQMILNAENISFDQDVLFDVARVAEGSLRDAQSLLDQVISFCGQDLKANDLELVLGLVGHKALASFVGHILTEDYVATLKEIQKLNAQGKDIYRFVVLLIQYIRDLIVLKVSRDQGPSLVDMTDKELSVAQDLIKQVSLDKLLYMSQILMKAEQQIKQAPFPCLPLEMCVIKMIQAGNMISLKALLKTAEQTLVLEKKTLKSKAVPHLAAKPDVIPQASPPSRSTTEGPASVPWERFLSVVKAEKLSLYGAFQKVDHFDVAEGTLSLVFKEEDEFNRQQVLRVQSWLEDTWSKVTGQRVKAQIRTGASEVQVEKKTPVVQDRSNQEILREPVVQSLLKSFEGKVTNVIKS